jgi:formylglycine-generating enzyme required for sulfatase activity
MASGRDPSPVDVERTPSARPNAESALRTRSDAWFLPDDELLGFVEIPAGPFLIGSDPAVDRLAFPNERWSASRAQVTVDLPAFYIGRYEVTVQQFKSYLDDTLSSNTQPLQAPPTHPVSNISWPDALAYCRWLEARLLEASAKDGRELPERIRQLFRDGWRVDLPDETQWEKAARGTDGRIFPWGNELRTDLANIGSSGTVPVGSIKCPECAYGLADMTGNVWELTRSPFKPYLESADDHQGLDADALWVMRGGSFNDPPRSARAAVRGGADPGARRPFIGFRLVLRRGADLQAASPRQP